MLATLLPYILNNHNTPKCRVLFFSLISHDATFIGRLFLLLEANLNYPVGSSFNTITKDLIGNTWNIISGITVAFVLYILTYAYISANGAIISETISMNLGYHANPRIVGICTAIFVASVLWISSLAASRITSLFLGLKIISFVIVFGSFFFQVDYSILRDATSTISRDIGISEDIENEGNGNTADNVPGVTD